MLTSFIPISNKRIPVVSDGAVIAPNFTQYEFWGGKDFRNETGDTHELSLETILAVQAVRDWANSINPNVGVVITSSYRVKYYNKFILKARSGNNSPHSYRIAIDFQFVNLADSSQSKEVNVELVKLYNTEIRDKGAIYTQLRGLGINGFGLYGSTSKRNAFIHLDARNKTDFINRSYTDRSKIHETRDTNDYGYGSDYAIWATDDPQFVEDNEAQDSPSIYQTDRGQEVVSGDDKLIEYVVQPDDPHTLSELIQQPHFPAREITVLELQKVSKDGVTNDRLIYDATENSKKGSLYNYSYVPNAERQHIPRGMVIFIPTNNITPPVPVSDGVYRFDANFLRLDEGYSGEQWPYVFKRITNDPGFTPAYRARNISVETTYPQQTVWLWSRVRYLEGVNNGWIDITADVEVLTSSDNMSGGSFNITLSEHNAYRIEQLDAESEQNKWTSRGKVSDSVKQANITNERAFTRTFEQSSVSERVNNKMFYEMIVSKGDLVFISFEKLNIDAESTVSTVNPAGKWMDMIGRVDIVDTDKDMPNGDVNTTLTGRDLSSTLIDDLAYFIPYTAVTSSGIGDSINQTGRLVNGNLSRMTALITRRSIKDQFLTVFHYLSSIDYIPEGVLSGFQNLTTESTYVQSGEEDEVRPIRGIYQLFKIFIDSGISDLKIVDDSLTNPQASVFELLKTACQEPYVQLLPMTIGDKYFLIARKAPFDLQSYKNIVTKASTNYSYGGADGPVVDSTDFGGVRGAYKSLIEKMGTNNTSDLTQAPGNVDGGADVVSYEYPLIVNIDAKNVITENLNFDDRSYAWFEIRSQGTVLGKNIDRTGIYPVAYFNEIAEIFGNTKFSVTSNYVDWSYGENSGTGEEQSQFLQNVNSLLLWLVDTHIYLPFTRKGRISINGDRRIRKGMHIYYRPTREVFYVTSVTNSVVNGVGSVDRMTNIEVERGMKIDYIEAGSHGFSYFNIVNRERLQSRLEKGFGLNVAEDQNQAFRAGVNTESYINQEVLNFFLRKRQFGDFK